MESDDRSFKCINCGTLNLVSVSQQIMEDEKKEEWNICTSGTARRRFKEICASKGNFNDGLLYLIALYEKEVLGKNAETQFGVPGTGK